MTRTKQPTILDRIMNEVILLGGLPVTRATAYRIMKADGHDERTADYFSFSFKTRTAPEGTEPWTFEQFMTATEGMR